MTGGNFGSVDSTSSVEVYHPGTNTSCTLPSLPEGIAAHSQDGFVQCGGLGLYHLDMDLISYQESCHTLNTDTAQWTKTHSLAWPGRVAHTSFVREDGSILLISGSLTPDTTELVSDSSGVSTPEFTLKYDAT